ncbi:hypothetical protein GGU10DRAFT_66784 [Lentinula aff. detonsa]|uniref:Uncharacterized protein n=1 Tax=Lentinula aff. detonsa TaxID=2804958 RepID=A0AA38NQG8_9AGAR|nr:hypothetical protein GGU10DRAFT_66784 [Lentinula aff. detonsa]
MHLYHRTSFRIYFALFLVFVCTAMPFSAYSDAPTSVHLIGEKRTMENELSKSVALEFLRGEQGQAIAGPEVHAKLVRYLDVVADALGFSFSIQRSKAIPFRDPQGIVLFRLTTKEKAEYFGLMAVGSKSNVGREMNAEEQRTIGEEPLTDFKLGLNKGGKWEIGVEMKDGKTVSKTEKD